MQVWLQKVHTLGGEQSFLAELNLHCDLDCEGEQQHSLTILHATPTQTWFTNGQVIQRIPAGQIPYMWAQHFKITPLPPST